MRKILTEIKHLVISLTGFQLLRTQLLQFEGRTLRGLMMYVIELSSYLCSCINTFN